MVCVHIIFWHRHLNEKYMTEHGFDVMSMTSMRTNTFIYVYFISYNIYMKMYRTMLRCQLDGRLWGQNDQQCHQAENNWLDLRHSKHWLTCFRTKRGSTSYTNFYFYLTSCAPSFTPKHSFFFVGNCCAESCIYIHDLINMGGKKGENCCNIQAYAMHTTEDKGWSCTLRTLMDYTFYIKSFLSKIPFGSVFPLEKHINTQKNLQNKETEKQKNRKKTTD